MQKVSMNKGMSDLIVLFSSVGRRTELIRFFTNKDGIYVIGVDVSALAPAAYMCHKFFKVPNFNDAGYVDVLLDICRNEGVSLLIPLHEGEFNVLLQNRRRFEDAGCRLLLSSEEVISICQDKYNTFLFFQQNGVNTPATILPEEIEYRKTEFPLFIKPRNGMGSRYAYRITDERQLRFFIEYVPCPIVQEFIDGTEYTVDVLCDMEGQVISTVPRERIEVKDGEISKGRTVKDWRIIKATTEVAEKLKAIGPLTIQCIIDKNDNIFFIEINPRFGGGVPLAIEAGVNYPDLLAKMLSGEKINPRIGDFQDNLYILRYINSIYKKGDELL
ncbi:ATP-grasp domain-containing protein [Mahella australiensis]|uniref:ATP-grasp domain-containing protein n=1 Tax=Mahella australiensis (strain DSM 15567 / CIP 107919 / 50-1 BON) TaxID=697281 RepID=F3ZYZ6_MAHA5|nr:ATP-grasp domain-containing protein [Mahella australiensis]AEE96755.1 protein of unknown function DUF201 [Mahella australiensis 50-1 BON]